MESVTTGHLLEHPLFWLRSASPSPAQKHRELQYLTFHSKIIVTTYPNTPHPQPLVCRQQVLKILSQSPHNKKINQKISGGPLSALTCCVNVRLLSAIKKISPLIYSQSWVGSWVYTTQAMMTFTLIF